MKRNNNKYIVETYENLSYFHPVQSIILCFMYFVITQLHVIVQNRCVNMIAHLFNAPLGDSEAAVGVGTVGSSEAIMLAGLAFKRKWQIKRKAEGKPCDRPNIVTGANVQVINNSRYSITSKIHTYIYIYPTVSFGTFLFFTHKFEVAISRQAFFGAKTELSILHPRIR